MMKPIFYALILSFFAISCEKEKTKIIENKKNTAIEIDTLYSQKKNIDNLKIYDLYSIENSEKKYSLFISLSDIYTDSLSVPNEIIQNQKNKTFEELKRIELTGIYRERLLNGTKLTENDTLFLYNYSNAKLQKFPIHKLKSVAHLNLYQSEGDEINEYSYMIGFELNDKMSSDAESSEISNSNLAYFGKENPFSGEKLIPVHWFKMSKDQFPLSLEKGKNLGNTYFAQFKNLKYYLQDYNGDHETAKRQLAIVKNGKVVFVKNYTRGEGAEFSPLNFIDSNGYNDWQWTGNLFKDKPPVIFDFVSESFGCPSITFLDSSFPDLYINCDNRH